MTRFRVKLLEEDYEEIGFHRTSPKKVAQVFRLLIDPPDREKQKQLHEKLDFGTIDVTEKTEKSILVVSVYNKTWRHIIELC